MAKRDPKDIRDIIIQGIIIALLVAVSGGVIVNIIAREGRFTATITSQANPTAKVEEPSPNSTPIPSQTEIPTLTANNTLIPTILATITATLAPPTKTFTPTVTQTPTASPLTAVLSEVSGQVQAKKLTDSQFADVNNNYVLEQMGQLKTMDNSKARLDTTDGNIIRLGSNTLFTLQGQDKNPDNSVLTRVSLALGQLWVILKTGSLDVQTPTGLASVRGSFLGVTVLPTGEVMITCLEGICELSNNGGTAQLVAGQTATITDADLPPQTGHMTDQDVIVWLQNNPEATAVILPLIATVSVLPTTTTKQFPTLPASTTLPTWTLQPTVELPTLKPSLIFLTPTPPQTRTPQPTVELPTLKPSP